MNPLEIRGGKEFLWAGRTLFLKNVDRLRSAFEQAQKAQPDIKLKVLTGLYHNDLMEYVQTCYAVVIPSLSEVSPNLALEAIENGKPLILTKETGIADRLQDVALFVNPLDEQDIAVKILWLADDAHYKEQLKKIRTFNFIHTYKQIAQEFEAIL